ncbi:MAG: pseudouridine synthase [Vicinamibacterales bacterium]
MAKRVRLDRAISKLGLASRSEARRLITAGKVLVGGRQIVDPATEVLPQQADIRVDGRAVPPCHERTIILNKSRGVLVTRRDPEGRPTVFDLLGPDGPTLVAAGRLDMATTGLLLLTTDTQLAEWLTNPANGIIRRYVVTVRGALSDDSANQMTHGIAGMRAAAVRVRKRSTRETHLLVDLTEGKNREIRRLCEALGHEVTALKRIAFGSLGLGDLQPGEWRDVTREEVAQLRTTERQASPTRIRSTTLKR